MMNHRRLLQAKDLITKFTDDDYNKLKSMNNIEKIIKEDLLIDKEVYVNNDNSKANLKKKRLIYICKYKTKIRKHHYAFRLFFN